MRMVKYTSKVVENNTFEACSRMFLKTTLFRICQTVQGCQTCQISQTFRTELRMIHDKSSFRLLMLQEFVIHLVCQTSYRAVKPNQHLLHYIMLQFSRNFQSTVKLAELHHNSVNMSTQRVVRNSIKFHLTQICSSNAFLFDKLNNGSPCRG